MIPVLAVPVLQPGRIGKLLASLDQPIGELIVIDQGAGIEEATIHLPHNIGVAAAWNLALKLTPHAEWWAIVNDDVVFSPGDLGRLAYEMASDEPHLAVMDGFAAFGINRAALELLGYFDENFVPAYCEDADYEYRCRLVRVPILPVVSGIHHDRSSTIADPRYGNENARTYPENVAYFEAKWGGRLRGGETFTSPFDTGAEPWEWTPEPRRRRELDWR